MCVWIWVFFEVEYEMFVDNSSASEIDTSQASMNRTGKTNAAKGVKSHYNEYKDFHKCEVEGHILAAFMELSGMSKLEGTGIGGMCFGKFK